MVEMVEGGGGGGGKGGVCGRIYVDGYNNRLYSG